MLAFYIYLIGILDNLQAALYFASVAIFLFILGYLFDRKIEEKRISENIIKKTIIAFCIVTILTIFIPSSKTVAAMYLIPKMVNNEQIQNISKNSLNLLENYTKEWLDDLVKDKIKEKEKK